MNFPELAEGFAAPSIEYRPEVRWWLAEGLHTDETLRAEVEAAHRLGFGGMEFLAMDEAGIDHVRYGWGSEEWVHDTQVVVEETTRRGMAVSFTSGTAWANANLPTITPDHPAAAKELDVTIEQVGGGAARRGALRRVDRDELSHSQGIHGRGRWTEQTLCAAVAARVIGSTDRGAVLDVESVVDLTDVVVDEQLEWTAPEGDWRLYAFWMHGTGQTASPSASVNYLDRDGVDAVTDYWRTVVLTPELQAQIAANPRAQMHMDSVELSTYGAGGLFWGRTVAHE